MGNNLPTNTKPIGLRCGVCIATVLLFCFGCLKYKSYELPLEKEVDAVELRHGTDLLPDLWWQLFQDENLNAHIETALNQNFSLVAAWERFNAAQALARKTSSNLYPRFNLEGNASRRRDGGQNTDQYGFGGSASYELDLWGRVRAETAAEDLRALASEKAYRTAALTLSANIATVWSQIVEANSQKRLLEQQIQTNEKTLAVLNARFEAGQNRREDILRQELVNKAVIAEKITVEADLETLNHQLAVLRGEMPQKAEYAVSKVLPTLAAVERVGISGQLVKRRPDVQQAYLEIEAADKDLAAAIRDQYPRITLSASYISEAASAGKLLSNWIATLAGGITAPLFDGGQRRAEVFAKEAVRNELIATYAQTVLRAFQDVENALSQELKQRERLQNLEERLRLAKDAYEQVQLGHLNGANEFLSVLDAQIQLQSLERSLVLARRNLIEFRIALYRALGGGFQTPREKTMKKDQ